MNGPQRLAGPGFRGFHLGTGHTDVWTTLISAGFVNEFIDFIQRHVALARPVSGVGHETHAA